jgi:hypothetical protein
MLEESIYPQWDEDENYRRNDLIPFATDPGGRPFYVSIGSNEMKE